DGSFDRLFPNQDYHSGKGLGNLIALPLNGKWMAGGNTCFIDPDSGESFNDQWKILEEVQKVTTSQLNQIYSSIEKSNLQSSESDRQAEGGLEIILDNQVWLNRNTLASPLISYIREQLNFLN